VPTSVCSNQQASQYLSQHQQWSQMWLNLANGLSIHHFVVTKKCVKFELPEHLAMFWQLELIMRNHVRTQAMIGRLGLVT